MKLAVIPARGGSKRIKSKNIIDFCGKPIISYALEAAAKSGIFDKIHVSTESDEIKAVVESLGVKIDFMRPKELADDYTGLLAVLKWVVSKYREEGIFFDDVCCLMPCAPLVEADDIIRAFDLYMKHARQYPLYVVAPFPVPVEWAFRRNADGFLTPVVPGAGAKRSQDLESAFFEAGPFTIFPAVHVLEPGKHMDSSIISMVTPLEKAVDIDTAEDLQLAETLYLGRQARLAGNE